MLSDQDHDHRQPETDEAKIEEEEMYLSDALELLGRHQEYDGPGEPVDIQEMLPDVLSVIDELDEELSEDALEGLGMFFPEHIIVSAFDLLDRSNVIKYVALWGKVGYEVLGESTSHLIQMDLPSRIPWYCSCPSFLRNVLRDKSHIMCKHILGTLLARKLSMTMDRPITADELLEVFQKHYNAH